MPQPSSISDLRESLDPANNSNLRILVTGDDPDLRAEIERRSPTGYRTVTVAPAHVSHSELVRVAELIRSLKFESFPQTDIHFVGVDVQNNRVRVEVDATRIAELESILDQERRIGKVEVSVVGGGRFDSNVCFRYDCISPMKAGIQIRKGSLSGGLCTMAFHVSSGTDEQMLTAGHCGYSGSNNWYHEGYGANSFGAELATWYVHNGVDAMKVGLPDAHASNLVFSMSGSVIGTFYPAVGETHCWSLGVTYFVDCGTITVAYGSWTGDLCNCTNWGSRASGVTTIDGDSGSPITLGSGKTASYATGIHNGNFSDGTVGFARVKQVLLHWNLTLPCGSPC